MQKIKIKATLDSDDNRTLMEIDTIANIENNMISYKEDKTNVTLDMNSNILIRKNDDVTIKFLFNEKKCLININETENTIETNIFEVEIENNNEYYRVSYRLEDELKLIFKVKLGEV